MNEHRTAREGERPRIDLEDEASVGHWTKALAVTRSQLEELLNPEKLTAGGV